MRYVILIEWMTAKVICDFKRGIRTVPSNRGISLINTTYKLAYMNKLFIKDFILSRGLYFLTNKQNLAFLMT